MVKPTSVDDIVAKFPTKILPPIPGEPDYDCIVQLNQLMYGNVSTLPTTLDGGAHSHVGLIMKATLYVTLSPTAYKAPVEPPLTPVVPPTATIAARQQLRDQHTEEQLIYTNHIDMDDALKTQLLDAVEDPYVSELRKWYTGYMGVTTHDILDRLMDPYGNITAADLKSNEARINESLNHSCPIDISFQRIDYAVQYTDDRKTRLQKTILQTAFQSANATGM